MALFIKFSTDGGDSLSTLDKLLQFSQAINGTEKQVEAINKFLKQLKAETQALSVGLFMKSDDSKKLLVYINGLDRSPPESIVRGAHEDFETMLKTQDWLIKSIPRLAQALALTLYHRDLKSYLLTPIISGKVNYGVIKIDLLEEINLSLYDEKVLRLMIWHLANRLDELESHQQLINKNCDSFFDKAELALRNNPNFEEAPKILAEQFVEFKRENSESPLPVKWRFYFSNARHHLKYLDIADCRHSSSSFGDEAHYIKNSHIHHFIKSNEAIRLYTQNDIKDSALINFHTHVVENEKSASLCINTGLRVNQVSQWGQDSSKVYVVIWANDFELLERYKERYQDLVKQFTRQIHARPKIPIKTDDVYLKKTQDIFEQLLRINDPKTLNNFVVQQAKALIPGTEVASYGEVNTEGLEPMISIKAFTEGCKPNYHKYSAHSIKNNGLWERLWETLTTIVVNNNYSQPEIKNAPIDTPKSAIVIPLFIENKLHGVLSLSASEENIFLPDKQEVLEWLVSVFSARLHEFKRRTTNTSGSHDNVESREIQSIAELIGFFTGDSVEITQIKDFDDLVRTAIKKIIPYTNCSCWGLFKHEPDRYRLLEQRGLKKEWTALNNLQHTPVGDMLRGEDREIRAGTIRSDSRFSKLLPLLPTTTESCLALPISIQEYRSPDNNQADKPRAETRLLALFLFHYHADKFSNNDLEFLKLTISLLEALMRQRAFQNEIDRITPLALSGAMAAQIAHEIKNPCQPLNSIISIFETAQRKNLWEDEAFMAGMEQRLKDAKTAIKRINANVVHLIHLSYITHLDFTAVSIEEVLKDVCSYQWYGEAIEIKIEQPIEIKLDDLPSGLPSIRFDKFHLSTILTNLIQNSAQAIESTIKRTGEIHLGAILHNPTKQDIKNKADKALYPLEIYVKDNGPGIAADVKRRMFLPFETTKKKGTGLGCTICQRMMSNIGGKIEVESVLGQGASMRLLFHKDSLIPRR